jgi:hypothetical protein
VPLFSNAPAHEGRSLMLHSTWTGIVMSFFGAGVFLAFSIVLVWDVGANMITIGLLIASVILGVVAAVDLPIAAEFRSDGVVRRTAVRHQFIDWDRVNRMRRLRVGVWRTRRDGRGGGLIADIKGRKYVLVDTMESAIEFDDLRRVMGEWADALGLGDDLRPPDGRSPTWLYRRDHWKPDSARSR